VLYYSQHRVEEAIAAYKIAIELDPSMAQAHKNLGEIYAVHGRYDLAREHARAASRLGDKTLVDMLIRYNVAEPGNR